MTQYSLIPSLETLINATESESITSRTFYKDKGLRAILFHFDAGQELSEHTSSQTAIIEILKGEATITLGDETHKVKSGTWLRMSPNLKHSIIAKTPLLMLLLMFGNDES